MAQLHERRKPVAELPLLGTASVDIMVVTALSRLRVRKIIDLHAVLSWPGIKPADRGPPEGNGQPLSPGRASRAKGDEIHWGNNTILVNTSARDARRDPRGATPVMTEPGGTRQALSMISTSNTQGRASWMIVVGALHRERPIRCLQVLAGKRSCRRKNVFPNPGKPVAHHCKPMKARPADTRRDIEVL